MPEIDMALLQAALDKTYGPLEGRGVPGLMWRAAEVLDIYAGKDSRSLLAENLRTAAIDICRAIGLRCSECGLPRPLLPFNDKDICQDCLRTLWRKRALMLPSDGRGSG